MFKLMSTINKAICLILLLIAVICLSLSARSEAGELTDKQVYQFEEATHVKTFYIQYRTLRPGNMVLIDNQPVICTSVERNVTVADECVEYLTLPQWLEENYPKAHYVGFKFGHGHGSHHIILYYIGK